MVQSEKWQEGYVYWFLWEWKRVSERKSPTSASGLFEKVEGELRECVR